MTKALVTLLLLAPIAASPCSITEEPVPQAISEQGDEAIRTFRMQKRFDQADVVFSGTVVSISEVTHWDWLEGKWTNIKAEIQHSRVWKNDGGDLGAVWTSTSSCGTRFKVGSQYVFLAGRHESFWSFLPWVDEPLGVGVFSAVWIGPLQNAAPEDLEIHRQLSLMPLSKVLHAPDLLGTPSN